MTKNAKKPEAMKAGVWIDHRRAVVVLLTAVGQEIKQIAFDIGQPNPAAANTKAKKRGPNDFIAEDKLERKVANDRKDYYRDVISAVRGVDTLLILGPGEAKGELGKQIKSQKVRNLAIALETADKMTDRQLAAKIRDHFTPAAGKSAAPKAKAKAPSNQGTKRSAR